jgi:hypothetical protein
MRAPATWTNDCYRLLVGLRGDGLGDDVPDELAGHLAAARASAPASADDGLAIGLVLARNKVTHIFELVKAIGSARQVEFDRASGTWGRRETIARKHAHETSVDPFAGALATGVAHAPLLYASDPRTDLPDELASRVGTVISDLDPSVIRGWLTAADA